MAEYCSSGIWVVGPSGPFRHGMIRHERLRLSAKLSRKFSRWIHEHDTRLPKGKLDLPRFNRKGRALMCELQKFLGPRCVIEYEPIEELEDPEVDPAILEWIASKLFPPAKRRKKK